MLSTIHRYRGIAILILLALSLALPGDSPLRARTAQAGTAPTLEVPSSEWEPGLNGECGPGEYSDAVQVPITVTPASATFDVYLKHTADFLYVCFDHPPAPQASNAFVTVYLDLDHNGGSGDGRDLAISMPYAGGPSAGYWSGSSGAYDSAEPGGWATIVSTDQTGAWLGAEFKISQNLVGGWERMVGLALFYHWYRFVGDDYAWPADNVWANPQLWGNAHVVLGAPPAACMFGDVNNDCAVDDADLALAAGAWRAQTGQPNYLPGADLNHDGVVNILDLERTAAQRGRFSTRGGEVHGFVAANVNWAEAPDLRLPGISVYLKNPASGATGPTVKTDAQGRYILPKQAPGSYDLCVEASGFVPNCDSMITMANETFVPSSDARLSPQGSALHGRVLLQDGTICFRRQIFFGTLVTTTVRLLDPNGRSLPLVGPVTANSDGYYFFPNVPGAGSYRLEAQCGAATVQQPITVTSNDLLSGRSFDLTLPNAPPVISELVARNANGAAVRRANPGDALRVSLTATDPDGDPLHYQWGDGATGVFSATDSATITWTLSVSPALNSLYVQVTDNKGGFALDRIRIPTGETGVLFSGTTFEISTTGTISPALAGVTISVNGQATTSLSDGTFSLRVPEAQRYVLNASKPGYALASRILHDSAVALDLYLGKAHRQTCDPRAPCTVVDAPQGALGASVNLDANTLVDRNGTPANVPLYVDVYTYDLAHENGAPGDGGTRDEQGQPARLEGYTGLSVQVTDDAGRSYNLMNGAVATVTLPVNGDVATGTLPITLTLSRYLEDAGTWQTIGQANRLGGGQSPARLTNPQFTGPVYTYQAYTSRFGNMLTGNVLQTLACIQVTVDEAKVYYPFKIRAYYFTPTGSGGVVMAYSEVIPVSSQINGFFNMEPNITASLVVQPAQGYPIGVKTYFVNTGANLNVQYPPYPYSGCGGKVTIALDAPSPTYPWLSNKGTGSTNDANYYYVTGLNANQLQDLTDRRDLFEFKNGNGFFQNGGIAAYYYNAGDLGLGREMHCKQGMKGGYYPSAVACFVTNYGAPGGPHETAFNDMFNNHNPVATVAMEYSPDFRPNSTGDYLVKFFVFDAQGNRVNSAELDSEGPKYVPHVCLACHGGDFGNYQNPDKGARFLPFDLYSFKYDPTQSMNYQMENFRKLNQMVLWTSPDANNPNNAPISYLLGGMYNGNVNLVGAVATNLYVPPDWSNAGKADLYRNVVKPYCRTCHIAQYSTIDWTKYSQFLTFKSAIDFDVCKQVSKGGSRSMPHAEVTFKKFWLSLFPIYAPAYLADATTGLGFTSVCVPWP